MGDAGSSSLLALAQAVRLSGERRLHELSIEGSADELLVHAWSLREVLGEPFELQVVALGEDAGLDIAGLLHRPATLWTTQADGSRAARSGLVTGASAEDGDGALTRYRLRIEPWIALLARSRRLQVWPEGTGVVAILESVFARYRPQAQWRWASGTEAHLAQSPYQHAERLVQQLSDQSELEFVQGLLAREGIGYRFESSEDGMGPGASGQCLVLFADSTLATSCPEDACSAGLAGVRFQGRGHVDAEDGVQAFGARHRLLAASSTVLAWEEASKRSMAASVPTLGAVGGAEAPALECYEPQAPGSFKSSAQAERAARLHQEAIEARRESWHGRSTVRSFAVGHTFVLNPGARALDAALSWPRSPGRSGRGHPAAPHGVPPDTFLLTEIVHAGLNNLPPRSGTTGAGWPLRDDPLLLPSAAADAMSPWADFATASGNAAAGASSARTEPSSLLSTSDAEDAADLFAPWVDAALRTQVRTSGYANRFEALRAEIPWRPLPTEHTGMGLPVAPAIDGLVTATVVGRAGEREPVGAEEICTDHRGRIRIAFDHAPTASCWVRVVQSFAGPGMGLQFIPRIGQQVLVAYLDGQRNQPLVVGALYSGRGEGAAPATPGAAAEPADRSVFGLSHDAAPAGQGNLTGGLSPAWHGASPEPLAQGGQANADALGGFKTKEFGGSGFNQLVWDDTDRQARVQLATTQAATHLSIGHLIHQADNHRGSFRGLGFELRTDAYGALRGGAGLLLSSYAIGAGEPAGDNAAGIALAGQLQRLGARLSTAATRHESVALAGHVGATKDGGSSLDDKAAPYAALATAMKGMVSTKADEAQGDIAQKNTTAKDGKVPQTTAPLVTIAARAGLAVVAGQDVHFASAETVTLASGGHVHAASHGAQRIHSGQGIGITAGVIAPGTEASGTGITLVAGKGDIEVQAQDGPMQIAARKDLSVQSQSGAIDWAAAKKITLATEGGASITIEGGNITVACPGTMTVKAATKSFVGPEELALALPVMPRSICVACLKKALGAAPAFTAMQ